MHPNTPQTNYQQPFSSMPPVSMPPNPATQPVDSALRLVITLLFANLGLSAVLTILVFVFRDSIIDFQLAQMHFSPYADIARARGILEQTVWTRVASLAIGSLVYVLLIYKLRQGRRWAYLRVIWIGAIGIIGIGYLIVLGQYPVWMRIEQAIQACVLLTLLWAVTRKEVRYRFMKPRLAG